MEKTSAGDPIPANCKVIEIHVAELKQLFNAIDPSPFREKDLDPGADEFIVSWARDLPATASLALLVYLDRPAGIPEEAAILRDAIREYFSQRAEASRQRLRQMFRVGRTSLLIGITCLAASLLLGDIIASALGGRRVGELIRESLLIGGWVAMWRPDGGLGRDGAADGGFSLRLVADPVGSHAPRSPQPDAGAHRLHERRRL